MDPYNFEDQKKHWSRVPDDTRNYLSTSGILKWDDERLRKKIKEMSAIRYDMHGYRNYKNKWRAYLGLDSTKGKKILDFGCGIGIEALQFAANNEIYLADIVSDNVSAAKKVLQVHCYEPKFTSLINEKAPFITGIDKVDIFYCNGVLHHIPYADEVLNWAQDILNDDGEVRLMLYSDNMWIKINGSESPVEKDIRTERNFEKFVRFGDPVGKYADWYNAEKILHKFGRNYKLVFYSYITSKNYYLVAILKKRK